MPASLIKHRSAKSRHKIIVQVDSRLVDGVTACIPIGPKESDKKAAAEKIEELRQF